MQPGSQLSSRISSRRQHQQRQQGTELIHAAHCSIYSVADRTSHKGLALSDQDGHHGALVEARSDVLGADGLILLRHYAACGVQETTYDGQCC